MTLDEIKNGMVIETRNGNQYIDMGQHFIREDGFIERAFFNSDLTHSVTKDFDIVKVYKAPYSIEDFTKRNLVVIWEREEKEEKKADIPLFDVGDIIESDFNERGLVVDVDVYKDEPDYTMYIVLMGNGETYTFCQYELISDNYKLIAHTDRLYECFRGIINLIARRTNGKA